MKKDNETRVKAAQTAYSCQTCRLPPSYMHAHQFSTPLAGRRVRTSWSNSPPQQTTSSIGCARNAKKQRTEWRGRISHPTMPVVLLLMQPRMLRDPTTHCQLMVKLMAIRTPHIPFCKAQKINFQLTGPSGVLGYSSRSLCFSSVPFIKCNTNKKFNLCI